MYGKIKNYSCDARRTLIDCLVLFCMSQILSLISWSLVPCLSPVILDKAGAGATAIGWITGTIPQGLGLVLTPVVSLCSDRTSSRFGRRLPFLWLSAPFVCLALLAVGCGYASLPGLAVSLVFFSAVAVVPSVIFYCMIPDILPRAVIGRFTAWNGAGCSLVAAAFNYWGLAWTLQNIRLAMTIAALLYAIAISLLALVREIGLPPLKTPFRRGNGITCWIRNAGADYFRVCFQSRSFAFLFLSMGFNQASMILRTMFGILFATKTLEIVPGTYGRISGICAVCGAVMGIAVGRYIDRSHPVRPYYLGSCLIIAVSLAGYFFAQSVISYAVIAVLTSSIYAIQSTAYTPLLVRLFPIRKYGQLTSANTTICTLMVMLGAAIGGWLTQRFGYRIIFLWDFAFTSLATIFLRLAVIR